MVKFFTYVFNFDYKPSISSSLRVRVSILLSYFLVVLHLVLNNHEWVLAPFPLNFTDIKLYLIVYRVYSILWSYVALMVATLLWV